MSSVKFRYISLIFLTSFISVPNIVCAQVTDSLNTYYDTSAYIPTFYKGAIDYNLIIASAQGYTAEIERLINKGADVNAEFESGVTPIVYAVSNNRAETTNELIRFGADVNKTTHQYETPLLIAVKQNNTEITEALIRADADIDFSDKHDATSLHFASAYGFFQLTDLLIYYDASMEKKTTDGYTPLMASVYAGHTDISDLLLQHGANPDAKNYEGFTSFMIASYFGDTIMMDLLFRKGADIYAVNNVRQDALILAIVAGRTESVTYLMKAGKKWNTPDRDVQNPYYIATKFRRKEITAILEKNNIKGKIAYGFDQVSFNISSRFTFNDIFTGFSVSFKEPRLNAGIIAGFDTKLWYTKVLVNSSEHLFYQYRNKSTVIYAGLFKDFPLTDKPGKFNYLISTSLMAGYSFGNMLKGTLNVPGNKLLAIPSVTVKMTKMNFAMSLGLEYIKTSYYNNGPVWLRAGLSYNHFFDKSRSMIKPVKWY